MTHREGVPCSRRQGGGPGSCTHARGGGKGGVGAGATRLACKGGARGAEGPGPTLSCGQEEERACWRGARLIHPSIHHARTLRHSPLCWSGPTPSQAQVSGAENGGGGDIHAARRHHDQNAIQDAHAVLEHSFIGRRRRGRRRERCRGGKREGERQREKGLRVPRGPLRVKRLLSSLHHDHHQSGAHRGGTGAG